MAPNIFFKNEGPHNISNILKKIDFKNFSIKKLNIKIQDIKNLNEANKNDLTFLHSSKYKDVAITTKASYCVTSENLSKFLPLSCNKIIVKNVLFVTSVVLKMFYPKADLDYPDLNLKNYSKLKIKYKNVKFGNNVLLGKNIKIGAGTIIGSNTVIESNVLIGKNCVIGSFVSIKNSVIKDNVHIQDGTKLGLKGFGFIPSKSGNLKTPHIGKVVIDKGVEIGSTCTIDRGSLSDTTIGENTFLDNQVHIAHNVKIGKNCMIAGQVGFAGSSILGDRVIIGGQAGISGHLKIGSNVSIGGGSGVIKDIPNNSKVMGYPAIDFKKFLRNWKNND